VTKLFEVVKSKSNLVQKGGKNDVMSEISFLSQPKLCLSGHSRLDSMSHVTLGAELNMRLQYLLLLGSQADMILLILLQDVC
jgi:hypothetical protein